MHKYFEVQNFVQLFKKLFKNFWKVKKESSKIGIKLYDIYTNEIT